MYEKIFEMSEFFRRNKGIIFYTVNVKRTEGIANFITNVLSVLHEQFYQILFISHSKF